METILNLLLTPIPISSQIPHREQGRTEKTGIDGENRDRRRKQGRTERRERTGRKQNERRWKDP